MSEVAPEPEVTTTWLTVKEVSQRLKLSTKTVGGLCHATEIEAVNLGSEKKANYRITEESLEDYLNRKKVVPISPAEQRIVRQGGYRLLNKFKVRHHA